MQPPGTHEILDVYRGYVKAVAAGFYAGGWRLQAFAQKCHNSAAALLKQEADRACWSNQLENQALTTYKELTNQIEEPVPSEVPIVDDVVEGIEAGDAVEHDLGEDVVD